MLLLYTLQTVTPTTQTAHTSIVREQNRTLAFAQCCKAVLLANDPQERSLEEGVLVQERLGGQREDRL